MGTGTLKVLLHSPLASMASQENFCVALYFCSLYVIRLFPLAAWEGILLFTNAFSVELIMLCLGILSSLI